ncbi:hypothetical protein G3578_10765 [Brevibacillus sp. SYP-B805]|uniref:hypothetical protein n=1 Tax=Brevibacillus sp. SYP-B805 TaxID=1578199 RepID=UPI0013F762B2|nr:hypothetical protein [Brevibacillus sp. SYP-B805]NGQ95635.1 hypothetical protein [Brevibacillus sp. SYP-B805]
MSEVIHDLLQKDVDAVCYAFYRYEIQKGLKSLDSFVAQLGAFLDRNMLKEEILQEINQLLQMIMHAVEKKDFLIAADLLKYELLDRINRSFQFGV